MGLLSLLFGTKKEVDEKQSLKTRLGSDAEIVFSYLEFMESEKMPPIECVADISILPHNKDAIKAALLKYVRIAKDASERVDASLAYQSLAWFQEGIGDQYIGIPLSFQWMISHGYENKDDYIELPSELKAKVSLESLKCCHKAMGIE